MFWEGGCLKFRDTYIQVTKLSWRALVAPLTWIEPYPMQALVLHPRTQILIYSFAAGVIDMSDFLLDEETIFKDFFC